MGDVRLKRLPDRCLEDTCKRDKTHLNLKKSCSNRKRLPDRCLEIIESHNKRFKRGKLPNMALDDAIKHSYIP
jgi:hypothetical protein